LIIALGAERKFEPYADDGGTVVGIAGSDFCLIAADTRLAATEQYFIRSRNTSRVFEVRWIIIHIDDNGLIFNILFTLK
jgi:20S proteasome alpha/beta subunit